MGDWFVFVVAAGVAALWLYLLPAGQRGRAWHFALAPVPALVVFGSTTLPDSDLRAALAVWLLSGAAALALLLATWMAGTVGRNHGYMDVAYPIAPAVIAWTAALKQTSPLSPAAIAVLTAVTLWGARLAFQTFAQNHLGEREPYASWRAGGGSKWVWWSLFQVYFLQGVMLWIWSAPLVFAVLAPSGGPLVVAGFCVWAGGFLLQAVADRQLSRFRSSSAGKRQVLDTGVWALVRQPNYLGEAVMWWGYFIIGLAHPLGWIAIVSPIFTTWFMGFGSAGPFKERHMARTRGAAWQAYCDRTPRFFPFPRPRAGS
ncbi:MAG: DUF1295 domain-containing protein [Sphingopyxis sp.]|nr:DUF1295 domain-containing protein [Sphingopyxis sp.]